MAESIEESEAQVDQGVDAVSPSAEMAIGLRKGRSRGKPDPKLDTFLDEQTRLVRLQAEHLHEQRVVVLARLKLGRWKDRITLALQAMTALAGLAVAVAIGVMVWQAHEDHGAVIEPFSVPPDLAARGLSGQVAAAKITDKLAEMQAKTDSARAGSTYANNWGDDIKVEIPETGVSVNDLYRLLRRWLGHQTVVSGEIMHTPAGLSLTARTNADAGATFEGPEADLDKLLQRAAEAVYRRTQPFRYAALLSTTGSLDKAKTVLEDLAANGDATDRKWATVGLAVNTLSSGDAPDAERAFTEVNRRYPDFVMGFYGGMSDAGNLDHEQKALDAAHRIGALLHDGGGAEISPVAALAVAKSASATRFEELGDFTDGARQEEDLAALADYSGSQLSALVNEPQDLAFAHRPTDALSLLARVRAPVGLPPVYLAGFDAEIAGDRLLADVDREDWPQAIAESAEAQRLAAHSGNNLYPVFIARYVRPWLAYAQARSGRQAEAEATIGSTPLDCDTCLRLRGRIAAQKGDWASADRWFEMAVHQAPSIPLGYADWGAMLLAKGDVDDAIAKLRIAHQQGPHYADPLELLGEALMRKGDYAGAIARFAEADKDAPRWARNHLRWGEALMLSGRYAEARLQYEAANGMDLSRPDRVALDVLLARTASGPLHG
jgi:tetratricopeptide (TPR) repeat protein